MILDPFLLFFYQAAAASQGDPFGGLEENGPSRPIKIRAKYPNDDSYFFIQTEKGAIRVREIIFDGEFSLRIKKVPIGEIWQYQGEAENPISQSAGFPLEINRENFSIEFHKLDETGETHVLLRKLSDES